jgi:hypothetical protein
MTYKKKTKLTFSSVINSIFAIIFRPILFIHNRYSIGAFSMIIILSALVTSIDSIELNEITFIGITLLSFFTCLFKLLLDIANDKKLKLKEEEDKKIIL